MTSYKTSKPKTKSKKEAKPKAPAKPKAAKRTSPRRAERKVYSRVTNEQVLAKLNELMDLTAKALAASIVSATSSGKKRENKALNGATQLSINEDVLFHSA